MVQKAGSNAALGLAWILWFYPAVFYMLLQCKCWIFAGCLGVQVWHFGVWQAGDSRGKRVSRKVVWPFSVLKLEKNGLFYWVKKVLQVIAFSTVSRHLPASEQKLGLFQEQRTHPGCEGIPVSYIEKSSAIVELQHLNWYKFANAEDFSAVPSEIYPAQVCSCFSELKLA